MMNSVGLANPGVDDFYHIPMSLEVAVRYHADGSTLRPRDD